MCGFGFCGGGVAILISPTWCVCVCCGGTVIGAVGTVAAVTGGPVTRGSTAIGGLPRVEGVWGLGTATLSGPVTERFVATSGGECAASDKLSESRDIPPSDNREVSDIRDSDSECC